MKELRFYCFVHAYLSPIQHGIQTGHCAVDIVNRTDMTSISGFTNAELFHVVKEWAEFHKTFIVLNGGNSYSLQNIQQTLNEMSGDFPVQSFYEDETSMEGMLTCVGVILPSEIFDVEKFQLNRDRSTTFYCHRNDDGFVTTYNNSHKYFKLIDTVKSARLA